MLETINNKGITTLYTHLGYNVSVTKLKNRNLINIEKSKPTLCDPTISVSGQQYFVSLPVVPGDKIPEIIDDLKRLQQLMSELKDNDIL